MMSRNSFKTTLASLNMFIPENAGSVKVQTIGEVGRQLNVLCQGVLWQYQGAGSHLLEICASDAVLIDYDDSSL